VLRDEVGLRVVELSQEFLTWGAPAGLRQKIAEFDGQNFVSLKTLAAGVPLAHILLSHAEMRSLAFFYESYRRGDGPGRETGDGSGVFYDSYSSDGRLAYNTRYIRLSEIFMPWCDPPKLSGTIVAFNEVNAVFRQLDDESMDRLVFTREEMDGLMDAWDFYNVYR
jgi:hypothetical protein